MPHRRQRARAFLVILAFCLILPLPASAQLPALLPDESTPASSWQETRFQTGCAPGPSTPFGSADPPVPPLRLPPDQPETARLSVDTQPPGDGRPILGMGFNLEHTLWSCLDFRPVFNQELMEPFQPAIARVNTGSLPAAPAELRADQLNRAVYQSMLASGPYQASWEFLRTLNDKEVRVVLGVWGGPAQFTDTGERRGTLQPRYYDDYAEYVVSLVDFIERVQGVEVWAITIANEPDGGDGSKIPPEGVAAIAHQLALRLAPYNVKLYGPDTADVDAALRYLPPLLDDPVVADALAFVGIHQYFPEPKLATLVDYVRQRRPELPVIVTEYTSFSYGYLDDGQEAVDPTGFMLDVTSTLLAHYSYGADAALYWDAVDYLQPGHDAITRWGLLRGPADDFERRPWYYSLAQILPYLQPGARVLTAQQEGDTDVSSLAVRTADGGTAMFFVNEGTRDVDLEVELTGPGADSSPALGVFRTDASTRATYMGHTLLEEGYATTTLAPRSVTTLVTFGTASPFVR